MKFKDLKVGDKINFEIAGKTIETVYCGKFDFLFTFDTKAKILPKVTTVNKESIVILNLDLLNKYEFNKEEVASILQHEVGHIISTKQDKLNNLEKEYDADDYAISRTKKETVVSALEKTKKLIDIEGNPERKKANIGQIDKRISNINLKDKKKNNSKDDEYIR